MSATGKDRNLTTRQAAFVRHYAGGMSATAAARRAGYSDTYANREANQLLVNPLIRKALERLNQQIASPAIATAEQRQQFWTDVMHDAAQDMKNRLKAAELLGKAQGDFVTRIGNADDLPFEFTMHLGEADVSGEP